ncbi:uncharacterized protein NDAI_0E04230 [Naumovozyma dairenensis CBS 421]|uniref:Uncharacterized protein n=1 Tax=Naumovozyma dairenensis (strain ATCC 10597 / BCRC 20456 / CBS 421 / NBRC 0211 / NRRL Y-12639) TaxID=1071378 RepID=G0WBX0_NAUDC|nr:hypothetical protein NDAI_0E04230 [Naumovozyma dairenensis CBS 421]CCD25240.1 hypothetical protein NDAI_0E04230 [Naumovozyma dairenensis CBS 421]
MSKRFKSDVPSNNEEEENENENEPYEFQSKSTERYKDYNTDNKRKVHFEKLNSTVFDLYFNHEDKYKDYDYSRPDLIRLATGNLNKDNNHITKKRKRIKSNSSNNDLASKLRMKICENDGSFSKTPDFSASPVTMYQPKDTIRTSKNSSSKQTKSHLNTNADITTNLYWTKDGFHKFNEQPSESQSQSRSHHEDIHISKQEQDHENDNVTRIQGSQQTRNNALAPMEAMDHSVYKYHIATRYPNCIWEPKQRNSKEHENTMTQHSNDRHRHQYRHQDRTNRKKSKHITHFITFLYQFL